jgi:DNA polymerase-3 subunit delta
MNHFRGLGIPMWFAKAEQVSTAATRFPKNKLEEGVDLLFRADRDLKGTRPDDRLVLEDFVMRLTAS